MRRTLITGLLAATASAGGLLAAAGPAAAATLTAPAHVHLVRVTHSAVTVTARPAGGATGYRLLVSARRSDLHAGHTRRARASAVRAHPRITLGRLPYRTTAYYYRFESRRGSRTRLEATIHVVHLRPSMPRSLRAAGRVPSLTWSAGPNTGYRVDIATNRAMTTGRRHFALRALTTQFTPPGLAAGRRYWFRITALNHGRPSPASAAVDARVTGHQQPLRVMTYNVLEATDAGQIESGRPLASWSRRRPGVVALIRDARPDVLAVQEAAAWIGQPEGYGGTRQVDDLAAALGSGYALASTETPPSQHGYHRTANYLLYRSAAWSAVGPAGHWDVGDGHFAAYQELRSRTTGARVLVVSVHLAVGNLAPYDAMRQRETQSLLRQAAAVAGPLHLPVIYAGDFNTDVNRNHDFDGPGRALRAAHVTDAEKVAPVQVDGQYDSANLNLVRPPALDQSIDYVYAGPGIAIGSRRVVLHLVHGRFPGVIPSDHNPVLALAYVPF